MRTKNKQLSAITTCYDDHDQALIIDESIDHFFIGSLRRRPIYNIGGNHFIDDGGVRTAIEVFIWEIFNERRVPGGYVVTLKDDPRDYRLKNLELVKVPKEKKSA